MLKQEKVDDLAFLVFFQESSGIIFQEKSVNLSHIESRPSKQFPGSYEFLVECCQTGGSLKPVLECLREKSQNVMIFPGKTQSEYKGQSNA